MRYALIIAGGSGTRLWPMSTRHCPKQLIPLFEGRSLLQVAMERLEGLLPAEQIHICAGEDLKDAMLQRLPGFSADRFIGEPMGRDTLNAVALGTGVLWRHDPEAVVAVLTADHLIEPRADFQRILAEGFELAEAGEPTLVTFGIRPTHPATGYGYLELGDKLPERTGHHAAGARAVQRFKEKPDRSTAETYLTAGPERYLWNSGMFVWRAQTLLDALRRFVPENDRGIREILTDWDTPARSVTLRRVYPTLPKISVDYAIMEPASTDDLFRVAALPMPLQWVDVGSWPSFGSTLTTDDAGNASAGGPVVLENARNTLAVSDDPEHLITAIGVEDLIIIRTVKATLVCRASDAEAIKQLHARVGETLGEAYL